MTFAIDGVTEIEIRLSGVTVRTKLGIVELIPPSVALIVEVPWANAVTAPALVDAIAATVGFDETHVTCEVRSCAVPSEYVPVAVNR